MDAHPVSTLVGGFSPTHLKICATSNWIISPLFGAKKIQNIRNNHRGRVNVEMSGLFLARRVADNLGPPWFTSKNLQKLRSSNRWLLTFGWFINGECRKIYHTWMLWAVSKRKRCFFFKNRASFWVISRLQKEGETPFWCNYICCHWTWLPKKRSTTGSGPIHMTGVAHQFHDGVSEAGFSAGRVGNGTRAGTPAITDVSWNYPMDKPKGHERNIWRYRSL